MRCLCLKATRIKLSRKAALREQRAKLGPAGVPEQEGGGGGGGGAADVSAVKVAGGRDATAIEAREGDRASRSS